MTGLPYFIGTSTNFLSSTTNGLEIYWDVQHPQGDTVFLNHNWWTIGA